MQVLLNPFVERLPINAMRLEHRLGGLLNVRVAVRKTDHERRRDHAPPDQLLQEECAERLRGFLIFVASGEHEITGPAENLKETREPIFRNGSIHELPQTFSLSPEEGDNAGFAVY